MASRSQPRSGGQSRSSTKTTSGCRQTMKRRNFALTAANTPSPSSTTPRELPRRSADIRRTAGGALQERDIEMAISRTVGIGLVVTLLLGAGAGGIGGWYLGHKFML